MAAPSAIQPSPRLLKLGSACMHALLICAWFELLLGLVVLGYAAFAEPTTRLLRGSVLLIGLGMFGLVWTTSWRRRLKTRA